MCKVSDKIKFCTCTQGDIDKEKHTWSFHRNIDSNASPFIGVTMGSSFDRETYYANLKTLTQRLNEPDAFDIELNPHENDFLQLGFTCKEERGKEYLGFIYKDNRWVEHHTSFFKPSETISGCLKSALTSV